MKILAAVTVAAGLLVGASAQAAQVYTVEAWTHVPTSSADNLADPAHAAPLLATTPTATFTWTGPINWSDTHAQNSTNTANQGTAFFTDDGALPNNFTDNAVYNAANSTLSEADFLASNLTIAGDAYSTFYLITETYTSATDFSGVFSHDDGASIYVDGTHYAGGSPSETSVITEGFSLPAGTHTLDLYYVSGNGTPSVLNFSGPNAAGVPEPASWALMILGFGGVGAAMRRRQQVALAA